MKDGILQTCCRCPNCYSTRIKEAHGDSVKCATCGGWNVKGMRLKPGKEIGLADEEPIQGLATRLPKTLDTHEGRTAEEWYKDASRVRAERSQAIADEHAKVEQLWSNAVLERDKRIKTLSEDVAKATGDVYRERDFELTCQVETQAREIEELERDVEHLRRKRSWWQQRAYKAGDLLNQAIDGKTLPVEHWEPESEPARSHSFLGNLPAYSGRGTIVHRDIKPTCQGPEDGDI